MAGGGPPKGGPPAYGPPAPGGSPFRVRPSAIVWTTATGLRSGLWHVCKLSVRPGSICKLWLSVRPGSICKLWRPGATSSSLHPRRLPKRRLWTSSLSFQSRGEPSRWPREWWERILSFLSLLSGWLSSELLRKNTDAHGPGHACWWFLMRHMMGNPISGTHTEYDFHRWAEVMEGDSGNEIMMEDNDSTEIVQHEQAQTRILGCRPRVERFDLTSDSEREAD